jgi:hypothetical protein
MLRAAEPVMPLIRLVLPALVLAAFASSACLALEPREVFKRLEPSMVVVLAQAPRAQSQGSGVIAGPTDVITSCHVVAEALSITVVQGTVERAAKVRFRDQARDLCGLRLDDAFPGSQPIENMTLSKDLEVGQAVYAIGSPRGLENTISRGIISGLRSRPGESARLIQTDAAVSPGSSGGGLFDESGKLIGIISFQFKEGNLNFALPADWVTDIAARNRDRLQDGADVKAAAAPSQQSMPPWAPRVGDRWSYALKSGGKRIRTVNVEITEARGSRLRERITVDGFRSFRSDREVSTDAKLDEFLDGVVLPGGYNLVELQPYLPPEMDLAVGKQWENVQTQFLIPMVGRRSVSFNVRSVGREDLKVEAGSYRTVKIEATAIDRHFQGNLIRIICTYWYASSVSRTVKMSIRYDTEIRTLANEDVFELVSAEPQQ